MRINYWLAKICVLLALPLGALAQAPVLFSESASTRAIAWETPAQLKEPFGAQARGFFGGVIRPRIMLFGQNLTLLPEEDLTLIRATAEDAAGRRYPLTVEYTGAVAGREWMSNVVVGVSDALAGVAGDVLVGVTVRGAASNRVRMAFGQVGGGPPDDPGAVPTPAPFPDPPLNEPGVTRYLTGNAADANTVTPAGPVLDLGGGGTDVDEAIQWMINQVRGCDSCAAKVDVVILRASGADGYNAPIFAMNGVDSVETLVIAQRAGANTDTVAATVSKAEVIFFAGGDQCNYVQFIKGTKAGEAVKSVYARRGGVGGTSAGLAIQGEFVYDGCIASATSAQALANPYHSSVSFTYDFYRWNHLGGVLTDSHFVTRDRMGRLFAYLARQIKDGRAAQAWGLAVNERTSVIVNREGLARVMGDGPAYFVLADHAPETCENGQPLTYSGFKLWKATTGQTFDLSHRPANGFYQVSVSNGQVGGNPY